METVFALAQVFLLVFIIVVGAWIFGLGLCRIADDENDDEQQMEWIGRRSRRIAGKKNRSPNVRSESGYSTPPAAGPFV